MGIFRQILVQRSPSTQITPSKAGRKDKNLIRLLHNGIIHRNILAQREILVNHFLLLVRIIIRKQTLEHLRNGRLIYAQGIHHRIYIPHKNTGIPEEIIFLNIAPGCFQIGFLFKRIHPEYLLIGGRRYTEISFNVTVARLRTSRFHAQGKDSVRIGRKIHRRINHPLKLRNIHHNVVAGGHHHIGLRITCLYFPTDVCYTRSRIATARLTQDMIISNIGQLLLYSVRILL